MSYKKEDSHHASYCFYVLSSMQVQDGPGVDINKGELINIYNFAYVAMHVNLKM